MKKLSLLLMMLVCLVAHAYESPYNNLGTTLNRNFKVSGKPNIENFARAIDKVLPIENEGATIDNKNGYIYFYQEGDGFYKVHMAVWNRTDGKKLFVVSYRISESATANTRAGKSTLCHYSGKQDLGDGLHLYNIGYRAFLYDAATSTLKPTKINIKGRPWTKNQGQPIYINMPRTGKDIYINFGIEDLGENPIFKWTGMGWKY